jgi:DNA-binding NtrC family response regulator
MAKSILVIDDDEAYGAYVEILLRRNSFAVQRTTSAHAGLKLMDSVSFDAVITDIFMPGCDGIELLRQVRHHHADVPVIGMTGNETHLSSVLDRVFSALGGITLLRKPVCASQLLTILAALPAAWQ